MSVFLCFYFLLVLFLTLNTSKSFGRREDDSTNKLKEALHAKYLKNAIKEKKSSNIKIVPIIEQKTHITSSEAWNTDTNITSSALRNTIATADIFKSADEFFNLTLSLANGQEENKHHYYKLNKIHIIRVPKASSSSLSAIARRAVGCGPPGPCCHYPGEPKSSCPSTQLFKCEQEKKVIGCTDHFPYLWYLFKPGVPTISMVRNPFARSLSAFFYNGIHHNSDCTFDVNTCFSQYVKNPKWQNVAVKLLTGDYAYSPRSPCLHNSTCSHSLQLAVDNLRHFAFMGVAEMWELSLLVLHRKLPMLEPNLVEFRMGTEGNSISKGRHEASIKCKCVYSVLSG